MVMNDAAGIFVYNTKWYGPFNSKVKGVRFCPIGNGQEMRWAYHGVIRRARRTTGSTSPDGGSGFWPPSPTSGTPRFQAGMRTLVLIVNRLAWFVPTLLGLMVITFIISHVIPADPVAYLAGENATNEQIAAIKRKFGLDQPVHIQFWRYLVSVLQGDMGVSLYTQRPISEDLLSPPAGDAGTDPGDRPGVGGDRHSARRASAPCRRNSWLDHVLRIFTVSGLAIASFWLAILLQLLFAMRLGWTPLQGRIDGWGPDQVTGFFLIDR